MVEWHMVLAGSVLDNNGDLVGLADRGVIPCQRKDSGWRRAVWDVQIQAFSLDTVLVSNLCIEQTSKCMPLVSRRPKMAPLQLRNLTWNVMQLAS